MVSLGHETKSVRDAEHMVLYIVDHSAFCFFLHECRNQVPHRFAQGPHILLKRCLQLRNKGTFRFNTCIAQGIILVAIADSANVVLDNQSLNYWSQRGTA